jgi:uncharacterized protein YdhG (YjbR/CyaY superfamily)
MNMFDEYIDSLHNPAHKKRMSEAFRWVEKNFPTLKGVIKWNQPMYSDHGTLIIGFSAAKNHMSFTPEEQVIQLFSEEIKNLVTNTQKDL